VQAQDEGELFDLYTREGEPLGASKPRGQVHRDGDWHRSLHLWLWAVAGGAPHVVLQRRSAAKDTWPGALDVAVAGHRRAGESFEETLREAREEVGLTVRPAELVRLGLRRREGRRPGVADNELQEIVARAAPVEVEALVPDPAELEALVTLPFEDMERVLVEGGEAPGRRLVREGGRGRLVEETIRGGEMIPAPDGYYAKVLASLSVMLTGGTPVEWTLG
jgi:isopentenyldiphosphate isomerase